MTLDFLTLFHYVKSRDGATTASGVAQATQHAHGCGLAGAISAKEPKNLTTFHVETNVVDCGKRPKLLGEFFYLYNILCCVVSFHCSIV